MKRICTCIMALFFVVSFLTSLAVAQPLLNNVNRKNGNFHFHDINFVIMHYGKNWRLASAKWNAHIEHVSTSNHNNITLTGSFTTKSGPSSFKLLENIKSIEPNTIKYDATLTSRTPVFTNELSLAAQLPFAQFAGRKIRLDQKTITLPTAPATKKQRRIFTGKNVQHIVIYGVNGILTISGPVSLFIQQWHGSPYFIIRMHFSPSQGEITKSSISLKLHWQSYQTTPLDIRQQVNMGFKDQTANDGKGGWDDQGAQNDLHMMPTGKMKFGGVLFDVINPKLNDGKSCMAFANPQRPYFLKQATIPMRSRTAKYLYLLHASAFTPEKDVPVGTLKIDYKNGHSQSIPVIAHQDVGNWWGPVSLPNGSPVWTAVNHTTYVGLYLSRFKLTAHTPIDSIQLLPSGHGVWMVVAMSTSKNDILLPRAVAVPEIISADKQWHPLSHPSADVQPDSALDFSFLVPGPAGQYGRLIPKGENVVFAKRPDHPVRFVGVNLTYQRNMLAKKNTQAMVDRLWRSGYNAVRLHHFDGLLTQGEDNSYTLNAKRLKRMDYLLYCLKKHGIYTTVSMYTTRMIPANESGGVLNKPFNGKTYKGLLFVSKDLMESWKKFARNLLTHKNPYTGMTWAQDPDVISIGLVNEGSAFGTWNANPKVAAVYRKDFKVWLGKNHLSVNGKTHQKLFYQFLTQLQINADRTMTEFLRSLGYKGMITGVCYGDEIAQAFPRQYMDYVDDHAYWDHPTFPQKQWHLPMAHSMRSAVMNKAIIPADNFASRLLNKPFMVTEFDYCFPNPYRSESGPLMGAYAALQNWSGLWHFSYTNGSINQVHRSQGFDIAGDPMRRLSNYILDALFLRGDVKSSPNRVPYLISKKYLFNTDNSKQPSARFPGIMYRLGLITGTGNINVSSKNFNLGSKNDGQKANHARQVIAVVQPNGQDISTNGISSFKPNKNLLTNIINTGKLGQAKVNAKQTLFVSDTGQITLNSDAGTFKVTTPKTEAFVLAGKGTLTGQAVVVTNMGKPCTVGVISLDNKPIKESQHLLILHLTDVLNDHMKFANQNMTILEKYGTLPHLVRRGEAKIEIKFTGAKDTTAYALGMSGKRERKVNIKTDGTILHLDAQTITKRGTALAYEIVRK